MKTRLTNAVNVSFGSGVYFFEWRATIEERVLASRGDNSLSGGSVGINRATGNLKVSAIIGI